MSGPKTPSGTSRRPAWNPTTAPASSARSPAAQPPAPGTVTPAPTLLDATDASIAGLLNGNRLGEPRSIRIVQGLLSAQPDAISSGDLAQRVAQFQRQSGFPVNGLIDESQTFPALARRLIANGDFDAVLFLIVDFFDLRDNGNLLFVYFAPALGSGRGKPGGIVRRDPEQPSSIQVGPDAFKLVPFEGLVHVLAHEMEHIRQLTGGPASGHTREFLAHSTGVMSEGPDPRGHAASHDPRRAARRLGPGARPAAVVCARMEASCSCGQLKVTVEGEPLRVSMCHCLACQRRTGSTYGAQARFPRERVRVSGEARDYVRYADDNGEGRTFSFCPECGATVYYLVETEPDRVAIALGAFADPSFPPPTQSVYESRRHAWVSVPEGAERDDD